MCLICESSVNKIKNTSKKVYPGVNMVCFFHCFTRRIIIKHKAAFASVMGYDTWQ